MKVRLNHLIFACRDFITVDTLDIKKPAWILGYILDISWSLWTWKLLRCEKKTNGAFCCIHSHFNKKTRTNSRTGTRNVLLSAFEFIFISYSSKLKRRLAIINEIQPSSSRQDANTALSWATFGCPWFKLSKPLQFQFRRLI